MQVLMVIQPGSEVRVGDGAIRAVVTSVSVGLEMAVEYRCSWWSGNERRTEWLTASEVKIGDTALVKIGFNQ